jgi:hypothetical protein
MCHPIVRDIVRRRLRRRVRAFMQNENWNKKTTTHCSGGQIYLRNSCRKNLTTRRFFLLLIPQVPIALCRTHT